MRVAYRTGRRSAVSIGPLGLLIALPFIAIWYMLVAAGLILWLIGAVLWALLPDKWTDYPHPRRGHLF